MESELQRERLDSPKRSGRFGLVVDNRLQG